MSEARREQDLDCGSHACRFAVKKTGMRTNGRCTCVDRLLSTIFEKTQRIAELEAEVAKFQEKDRLFSCEACYQKAWIGCDRNDDGAIESSSGGKQTWWRCEHCWLKAEVARLKGVVTSLKQSEMYWVGEAEKYSAEVARLREELHEGTTY